MLIFSTTDIQGLQLVGGDGNPPQRAQRGAASATPSVWTCSRRGDARRACGTCVRMFFSRSSM